MWYINFNLECSLNCMTFHIASLHITSLQNNLFSAMTVCIFWVTAIIKLAYKF